MNLMLFKGIDVMSLPFVKPFIQSQLQVGNAAGQLMTHHCFISTLLCVVLDVPTTLCYFWLIEWYCFWTVQCIIIGIVTTQT